MKSHVPMAQLKQLSLQISLKFFSLKQGIPTASLGRALREEGPPSNKSRQQL